MTKEKQLALEIGSIYMKSFFDFQDFYITRSNFLREAFVPKEILKKLQKQSNLIDASYREFWNLLKTKSSFYALDQAYFLRDELEDANADIEAYYRESKLNKGKRFKYNGQEFETVTGDFEKDKDWVSIDNDVLTAFNELRQKLKQQLKDIEIRISKLKDFEEI